MVNSLPPISSNNSSGRPLNEKRLVLRRDSSSNLSSLSCDSVEKPGKVLKRIISTDFPQVEAVDKGNEPQEFLISYPVMGINIRYIIRKFLSAVLDLEFFISKHYAERDKNILLPLLKLCRFEILRSDFEGTRRSLERIVYRAAEQLKAIFKELTSRYVPPFDLKTKLEGVIKSKSAKLSYTDTTNLFTTLSEPLSSGKKILPKLIKVPSIDLNVPSISPTRVCEIVLDLFVPK